MRLIPNIGNERVIDELRRWIVAGSRVDVATSAFSLFAFAEMRDLLEEVEACRVVLPGHPGTELAFLGTEADRPFRNRLITRWLASVCHDWLSRKAEVREVPAQLPQCVMSVNPTDGGQRRAIAGNCPFSTDGLGITAGNQFSLVQVSDNDTECGMFSTWFEGIWNSSPNTGEAKQRLLEQLKQLTTPKAPALAYYQILFQIFKNLGQELDEERIVKSATGIRRTMVWRKLFKFQRDGVIGAIDKLERFGGCIIADSVGLGKTFEALAIIKYFELRNDRVLVLVPKRLRDNWTLYKANDRRNILAADRLNYDVLNHTDLSRDGGMSGDIDLTHVNWGNYDLVVIDESHNFRNKKTPRAGGETRYDRLMHRIIQQGVKTRVLMLSATPVNNRLADLRNQIAFATEGEDTALTDHGIASIEATTRLAQKQFNRWLNLEDNERTPACLMEMLGRGLRLCVNQQGERLRGFEVNTLTVVATEGYEQFAENLQKEIEQDTGIRFGIVEPHQFAGIAVTGADGVATPLGFDQSKVLWEHLKQAGYVDSKGKVQDALKLALKDGTLALPAAFKPQQNQVQEILRKLAGKLEIKNADERRVVKTRQAILNSEEFKALWDRIKHKTTYRVLFDNEKLIEACIKAIQDAPPITKTRLQWRKADLAIGRAGVEATETAASAPVVLDESDIELPDVLTDLQDKTQLTRRTIARILIESGRLADFKRNPQQFIELAASAIIRAKRLAIVDGIKYQRLGDECYYAQELFEQEELTGYLKNLLAVNRSVYDHVVYQSETERTFAQQLDSNEAVKVFAKLPAWFKVPTPLGTYNPDWAVLVVKDGTERLYFVVETKSGLFDDDIREREAAKIDCGAAHFKALATGENPAHFVKAAKVEDLFA